VGETHLSIPPGAVVDLQIGSGTGEVHLDIADGAVVTARVRGGIGEMKVRLPQTAAARVEYSAGIGGAHVNSRLHRVKGGDGWNQSGVWQTSDYDTADDKILITFEGGIGGLDIR
jgi:molybdopterin-binding protein